MDGGPAMGSRSTARNAGLDGVVRVRCIRGGDKGYRGGMPKHVFDVYWLLATSQSYKLATLPGEWGQLDIGGRIRAETLDAAANGRPHRGMRPI
jgi:hypothetical protein